MLSFGEIINRVCAKVQILPTDKYATETIPRFIQDAYREIWESEDWDEIKADDFQITVQGNTNQFILAKQYGPIQRAFNNDTGLPLKIVDRSSYSDRAYNVGNRYLTAVQMDSVTRLTPSAVLTQLTSNQKVKVKSSSATDTTPVIWIRGIDSNGERVSEAITLTGTTPVASANTYASIEAWSKTARPTAGFISLTDNTGNTIATLGTWDTTACYQRYQINGIAATAVVFNLTCKKSFIPFENYFDYAFTEMDMPLIRKATALAWEEHRQLELAAAEDARGERSLDKVRSRELNQDNCTLFVPSIRA